MNAQALIERAQEQAERNAKELTIQMAIANALPSNVEPQRLFALGSRYSDAGMSFDNVGATRIGELMAALPPLPLSKCKGTFTSIAPRDRLTERDGVMECISPFKVSIERTWGYATHVKVEWWTVVAGYTCWVACELVPPHTFAQITADAHHVHGERYLKNERMSHTFKNAKTIRYASGSAGNYSPYVLYWGEGYTWQDVTQRETVANA